MANSVVALDGTPTTTKWHLTLGVNWVEHEEVLEFNEEKRAYLSDVLGLKIHQTKAGSKPYQSGSHVNVSSDAALLESIHETEGTQPAVITPKQAKEQYESTGVTKHIEGAEHYGNLKGSNEFAETRLGVILGSPHPPEERLSNDGVRLKTPPWNGRWMKIVKSSVGKISTLGHWVTRFSRMLSRTRFSKR